jgi:ATP-dependent protease HslVU (ClpYQ) peptidase subunit
MAALSGGTMVDDPVKARKIITKAVQIASKYDAYTGGKITITLVQENK